MSERYLSAIIIKDEGHVYTGRNPENWLIFFESKELMDNSVATIKHKATGQFLCSTYLRAQIPHNRLVQISDDEGRHTHWKIALAWNFFILIWLNNSFQGALYLFQNINQNLLGWLILNYQNVLN